MESAEKRIPFVCEYGEYMQMCEEICRDISEEQYRPDYDSFKLVWVSDRIEEEVKKHGGSFDAWKKEYESLSEKYKEILSLNLK